MAKPIFTEHALFQLKETAIAGQMFGGNIINKLIHDIMIYRGKLQQLCNMTEEYELMEEIKKLRNKL